jgi:hypothetical protein
MIYNLYEILDAFELAETKDAKKQVLLNNNNKLLQQVLQLTFDPKYEFYFKKMPTEYIKPDTIPGIRFAGLETELRRLYLFQKGNETADKLSEQKRKELFLQIAEALEPREAEILINIMKKDLGVKGLTAKFVKDTFPGLIP